MRLLISLGLSLSFLAVQAQEVCDNGIDDDADGLIDLNDTVDCACRIVPARTNVPSLLPNPSFEDHSCCPSSFAQLECADAWVQATSATTDYINTCGFAPDLVPRPLPDGNACVDIILMQDWREYVGGVLLTPLTAGTTYTLSWHVASLTANDAMAIWFPEPLFSALDLTLFGTTDTSALPVATIQCPTLAEGWSELGSVHYQPDLAWSQVSITFTPTVDIAAIMLGGPCVLPPDYPTLEPISPNDAFFFFDDLVLNESVLFGNVIRSQGSLCANDLVLQADPAAASAALQWYRNGVALPGQTGTSLPLSQLGLGAGTYQLRMQAGDTCSVLEHVVGPLGVPVFPLSVQAPSGCVPFTAQFTAPADAVSAIWDFGDGAGSGDLAPTHTYRTPGTYDVAVRVTANNGCPADTVFRQAITVRPGPVVDFTSDAVQVCPGRSVRFTDSTEADVTAYTWDLGDGTISHAEAPVHAYQQAGQYDVRLTVTTAEGCTGDTLRPTWIEVLPAPAASFTADPMDGTAPLSVQFTNTTPPSADQLFHWDLGTTVLDTASAMSTFTAPGEYVVYLVVSDAVGCSDTAWARIIVRTTGVPVMPNVFTPNGDGLNDRFGPLEPFVGTFRLTIHNRWGQVLFTTDALEQGWDGRSGSDPVPDGTYFWVVAPFSTVAGERGGSGTVTVLGGR